MKAIENITTRNSHSKLIEPHPTSEEMKIVYESALRAPDHAGLRPSQFIEVTGNGLKKLSDVFLKYANSHIEGLTDKLLYKYENAPYRAPMIIVLICNIREHPKVPEIEQMLSTAAAAQNILLSLHALKYGAIWRTGIFALNNEIGRFFNLEKNQKILGYLYVGTITGKTKKLKSIDIRDHVSKWS